MAGENLGLDLASQTGQEDIASAINDISESGLATQAGQADIVEAISGLIDQFATALNNTVIKTTSTATGSLTVTENGTYDAHYDPNMDAYDEVIVNVPNTYETEDEGKVVSNGSLVEQSSTTKTENGTYDTTFNDEVIVNVPAPELGSVVITENGTYLASDDDYDGYDSVTVNIQNIYGTGDEGKVVSNGSLVEQSSATKTENGTYDTTLNNSITVAIPLANGEEF